MAGLVPAISLNLAGQCLYYRDGRDKPGHDKWIAITHATGNAGPASTAAVA
jgi:hypothetical protein